MKLMVATKQGQGKRKSDFTWATEGEIVIFAFECDDEGIDGGCGCKRSMSGIDSHKATTTMVIVEVNITPKELTEKILASLTSGGWTKAMGLKQAKAHAQEVADELIKVGNYFDIGEVIEKRGDSIQRRLL